MKGITTHVMVIIFSLIIMIVLLGIGIGFVMNYTNIPFEKLWELTPGSGVVTNPQYGPGGGGTSGSNIAAKRFFTTSGPYDLSEIACSIGTSIFYDFSQYGTSSSRPETTTYGGYVNGYPQNGDKSILIGAGSFLYKTGTDTGQPDSVFTGPNGGQQYQGCHICREPETNAGGAAGITDLDELCISMQMRDRTTSGSNTPNFCGGSTYNPIISTDLTNAGRTDPSTRDGTFYIDSNQANAQFGDFDVGGTTTNANNNAINSALGRNWNWKSFSDGHHGVTCFPGCAKDNNQYDFCDNQQDRISWSAEKVVSSDNPWERKSDDFGDVNLVSGYKYAYGVYWDNGGTQYWIDFVNLPDENSVPTKDFDQFDKNHGNYFGDNNFRFNILGNYLKDARTVAVFDVNLGSTLSISGNGGLMDKIVNNDNFGGDRGKVVFNKAEPVLPSSGGECLNNLFVNDNFFKGTQVELWTNATGVTDAFGSLPVGKYRVVVRNWMGAYNQLDCFKEYEKSVLVYQIGHTTCTGLGTCMISASCSAANGGHNMGPLDCQMVNGVQEICCA